MMYIDTLSLYAYTLYYIGILLYTYYICIYVWSVINHNDVNPTIKNPEFSVNEMGNPPIFGQMTPKSVDHHGAATVDMSPSYIRYDLT